MALFNSVGTQIDTMTSTCQWDKTWSDSDTLGSCQCKKYIKYYHHHHILYNCIFQLFQGLIALVNHPHPRLQTI